MPAFAAASLRLKSPAGTTWYNRAAVAENTPIRIQYVISTLDRAGAEGQLSALLTRLDRERFEPHLFCLTRGGPLEEDIRGAGVPVAIAGKGGKLDPLPLLRLLRHLRRFRPQVLHTWMFTANAYGRAAGLLAGVPVRIASERAVDSWKTWPYRWTDRLLASTTHCIVANCAAVREFVRRQIPPAAARIEVIPNGVDIHRFTPRVHGAAGEVVFCSAGRLAAQKRMDLVLRALAQIPENPVRTRLRIAGEGPLGPELKALAAKLGVSGRVEWLGSVPDLAPVLASSDAFVLASDWEGMPNVVLEAMASGLPVAATAVDGTLELVRDGETGILIPPNSVPDLAAAIQRLAGSPDLRQNMGSSGRRRAESEFSMERMVQAYEALYERLLGK
ncbi:MAG: glycosyltransferase [Planctomycetes bacterium]|nr:glycosyltransferase [Planctomycetota bacterium]